MKKIIALISVALISLVAFAAMQYDKTASCKIEGVPGAYITAEAVGSGTGTLVNLRSYGVSNAGVTVKIFLRDGYVGENPQEKMGYIENGKGSVYFSPHPAAITSIKVYNAVCR